VAPVKATRERVAYQHNNELIERFARENPDVIARKN
jgi:hypothetical protein